MQITRRDLDVLHVIGRFKRLTSLHIQSLLFHDVTERPRESSLRRLVRAGYVRVMGRRMLVGDAGGSSPYVYELTDAGLKVVGLPRRGKPLSLRESEHDLATADLFCELVALERTGSLAIKSFETPPKTRLIADGLVVIPDLSLRVELGGRLLELLVEIDAGTQWEAQIRTKLNQYSRLEDAADELGWDEVPAIFFVTIRRHRVAFLETLRGQLPEDKRGLFRVRYLDDFLGVFNA